MSKKSPYRDAVSALEVNKPWERQKTLSKLQSFVPPTPPLAAPTIAEKPLSEWNDDPGPGSETESSQKSRLSQETKPSLNSKSDQKIEPSQKSELIQKIGSDQETQPSQNSKLDLEIGAGLETRPAFQSEPSEDFRPAQESRSSSNSEPTQDSRPAQKTRPTSDSERSQKVVPSLDSTLGQEPEPSSKLKPSQNSKPCSEQPVTKREVLLKNENGVIVKMNKKDMSAVQLVSRLNLSDGGWSRVTNRILEIMYQADFDKAEHEIIQFILRESVFWRQEWTDAMSGMEFENMSGISKSSLWTHLKRLTSKGWVNKEQVKEGEKVQARNRYRLNPDAWGPLFPKKRMVDEETEPSQETRASPESATELGQESKPSTQSGNQTGSSLYTKQSLKTDLNTSLSQAPEKLEERWAKMIDQGTREREVFLNLIETYGRPVWDHCADVLDDLKENGDLRKKTVGSPFGLLAQGENWQIFLARVLSKKAKAEVLRKTREQLTQSQEFTAPPESENTEPTSPPAAFLTFMKQRKRGPDPAMRVFEGSFADMEAMFTRSYSTKTEQWMELNKHLGSDADAFDSEKAKWIFGIQRWFHEARKEGKIAS